MRSRISAQPRRDASEHLQTRRGGARARRHEVGALTAPTDEAELTAPDPDVRGPGAWRQLMLGLAGFTLLVVPGLVAMTVLERSQPGRVEAAIAWARDGIATWWPNGSTSSPSAPVAAVSATPPSITPTNDSVPVLVDHHASMPRSALEHEGSVRSMPEASDRGRSAAARVGPRIEAEATTEPSVATIRWTPRPTATRARLIPATDWEDRPAVSIRPLHDREDSADALGH